MKKVLDRVKIFVAILLVILISLISFVGIWKKENGIWKNLIPDYKLGMDLKGARELIYVIDNSSDDKYVYVDENGNIKGEVWKEGNSVTEENDEEKTEEQETEAETKEETEDVPYSKETRNIKVNEDANLTKENFEKTKKIIQKRLNAQNLGEYDIRIDDVTGGLVIESKNDNDEIDTIEELVTKPGKIQIIDYQNGVILLDNTDIKTSSIAYSNNEGYSVFLQLDFNKDGAEKLREISAKYVETEKEPEVSTGDSDTEEDSREPEKEIKYVSVVIDGSKEMTTYFEGEITQGTVQIPIGDQKTDYDKFVENFESAKLISDRLNFGILPITYNLETDNFVKSDITSEDWETIAIGSIILIVILSIIYIIKFKKRGLACAVLNIGYIALLMLVIRYTNTEITMNSIMTGYLMIIMDFIFVSLLLKELKNSSNNVDKVYFDISKKFYLSIIPVIVTSLVFTLNSNYTINTIGMIAFWGLVLNAIYNFTLTKTVLKN